MAELSIRYLFRKVVRLACAFFPTALLAFGSISLSQAQGLLSKTVSEGTPWVVGNQQLQSEFDILTLKAGAHISVPKGKEFSLKVQKLILEGDATISSSGEDGSAGAFFANGPVVNSPVHGQDGNIGSNGKDGPYIVLEFLEVISSPDAELKIISTGGTGGRGGDGGEGRSANNKCGRSNSYPAGNGGNGGKGGKGGGGGNVILAIPINQASQINWLEQDRRGGAGGAGGKPGKGGGKGPQGIRCGEDSEEPSLLPGYPLGNVGQEGAKGKKGEGADGAFDLIALRDGWDQEEVQAKIRNMKALREYSQRRSNNGGFQNTNLSGLDLSEIKLEDADLTDADLSLADLTGAKLPKKLIGVKLVGVNLAGRDLTKADLRGAKLRNADLTDADLTDADLAYANLTGAYLTDADLIKADLTKADLRDAKLRNADLTDADLTDADLRNAILIGTSIRDANFANADFGGTVYCPKFGNENLPQVAGFALSRNTDRIKPEIGVHICKQTPYLTVLVEMRSELYKKGFGREGKRLTPLIIKVRHSKTKTNCLDDGIKIKADSICHAYRLDIVSSAIFGLTSNYSASPLRPLIFLGGLLLFMWLFFYFPVIFLSEARYSKIYIKKTHRNDSGKDNWRHLVSATHIFHQGSRVIQCKWWRALLYSLAFSAMSSIRVGIGAFNFGGWVRVLLPREFEMRSEGVVRVFAGVQSFVSIYLIALSILSLIGKPFG